MERHIPALVWQNGSNHQKGGKHGILQKEQLYLQTDVSGVGLRTRFPQASDTVQFPRKKALNNAALQPKMFARKSLTSTETWYSIIEKEAIGILHSLEKFLYYCFTHEVSVIRGHK